MCIFVERKSEGEQIPVPEIGNDDWDPSLDIILVEQSGEKQSVAGKDNGNDSVSARGVNSRS